MPHISCFFMVLVCLATITCRRPTRHNRAPVVYVYASQPGSTALDRVVDGGNPFAVALAVLFARDALTYETLRTELMARTHRTSNGRQRPDVPARADLQSLLLVPHPVAERREALVVVFSRYSAGCRATLRCKARRAPPA